MKDKININIILVSIIIGISIVTSAYIISNNILGQDNQESNVNNSLMNIDELSEYLRVPKEDICDIMDMERIYTKNKLYDAIPLKYYVINSRRYFVREYVDQWIIDKIYRMESYNTQNKRIERIKGYDIGTVDIEKWVDYYLQK
ncbi:hypothetical protein [Abyssisolibacter fermentans]|uniref:hypothetical protein n=1 Tax=Abyssisolibacter fermentans TaxID=1766203 RepID=UPI0008321805|nr:hypothetical protein [Abyssisolibacter fermentans]